MNEKINVLGVNIDSFTAKEAMKETIAFLESEPVSVIDVVSVDALMQMNDLPELKEKMNEFDMILPGEKLILEAAEEPELPEEINMVLYLKMFMRYLHKNHKRLYLLVESEEEGQEAFRYLQKAYSGIQLVGLAKVSAEGRADDMLVNAINTEAMVNVRLSFGTIIPELKEVSQSYKEAGMALDVGRIFYPERNILSYRELGIGRLIHQLPVSLCEMFLEEVFAGNTVDQFDEETLSTVDKFFENSLNISETARQLFVHRNTLVYRLEKIQKQTGLDVRVFEDALTFKIALMVADHMKFIENRK